MCDAFVVSGRVKLCSSRGIIIIKSNLLFAIFREKTCANNMMRWNRFVSNSIHEKSLECVLYNFILNGRVTCVFYTCKISETKKKNDTRMKLK